MTAEPGLADDALRRATYDVLEFVDPNGWDQPPQLFAFVPTALLARVQPEWAEMLDENGGLTPIEQDELPGSPAPDSPELEHVLGGTAWPDEVAGCALVQEVSLVPPDDSDGAERTRARLVVAVLRDGNSETLIQLRPEDEHAFPEEDVRSTPELAPNLVGALIATFDNEFED